MPKTTHRMTKTPTYRSWRAMRDRCSRPKNQAYETYGGRGIKVCERWANSFENFLNDMGLRPKGHTLDRIKSDGDYEPSNCRWATMKEQNRNKRVNISVEVFGETYSCVGEAIEKYGLYPSSVYKRLGKGQSLEEIITSVLKRRITYKNKEYPNPTSLARAYNVEPHLFLARLKKGKSVEEALTDERLCFENKYIYQGKGYRSLNELAKYIGVNICTLSRKFNKGASLKEAVEHALKAKEKRK